MKKIIDKFKELIRFAVTIFASREFAFIYCVLGVFAQIAHTYFLTNSISSFNGGFKIFQSVLLSAFISSSLLYFVAIVDNSDTKENKRNKLATNIFMLIEILINIYYYSRHLLIDSKEIQVFDFLFAILISGLIPVTIKLYGSHIRAHEWQIEDKKELILNSVENQYDEEQFIKIIQEKIDSKFEEFCNSPGDSINDEQFEEKFKANIDIFSKDLKTEIMSNFDTDVAEIFNKNQQLFLKQFENKCQLLLKKQIEEVQSLDIKTQ